MAAWLKGVVLETSPEDFGYDTTLWTCDLLAELISRHYNVQVIGATINPVSYTHLDVYKRQVWDRGAVRTGA